MLFGFPALAVWALKRGGRVRLGLVAGAALAVVMAFSVMAASPLFGNRLAASTGSWYTTTRAMLLFGISLGFPIAAASFAVTMLSRDRLPFWAVYAATVGAAAFGWLLGVIAATWLLPMFL